MEFTTATLAIAAGYTGDIEIPNTYPAISRLLGYTAITAVADTSTGELTVTLVTTGIEVELKDERTMTVTSNSLSHSGILVITYEPAITIKSS